MNCTQSALTRQAASWSSRSLAPEAEFGTCSLNREALATLDAIGKSLSSLALQVPNLRVLSWRAQWHEVGLTE